MNRRKLYFAFGRFFSPMYASAMSIRQKWYQYGIFKTVRMEVPVISIGNLMLGGTGKTPMTQYLARLLQKNGYHPAVISRGYGGATKEPVNVVSDGTRLLLDAVTVGDEPRLLAETLPGVPVLTGVVRRMPARQAVEMGADVLLLDDGFQHMAVARDLDLVLFSADVLAGSSRVFPGGELREPVKALRRCHTFVLTGVTDKNSERAGRFADLLKTRFPGREVFFSRYRPAGLVQLADDGTIRKFEGDLPAEHRCFAFCGIARPEAFARTLEDLGIRTVDFQGLPDHHGYRRAEVDRLLDRAGRHDATALVTTEKDLVKLEACRPDLPLYGIRMEVEANEAFDSLVLAAAAGAEPDPEGSD